jgi:peptide/nickel transport system ATP-binding protein
MAQLEIDNLSVEFRTRHGVVRALESVTLSVARGEIVGVVGESGSGKSVTAYTVMALNDEAAQITSGRITMGGIDILAAQPDAMRQLRGREMAMIFQSPRTALHPIRKVGKQIEDVLREHAGLPSRDLKQAAIAALARVRIPDPERRAEAYPFELSGGMCQRVMIAMALACSPSVLIADEPTTGLDVTTQAVIMDLIRDMSRSARMSTLLITHDLGLAGEYCDRIAVMHAGHVVEIADTESLFDHPAHPYTRQLLAATSASFPGQG